MALLLWHYEFGIMREPIKAADFPNTNTPSGYHVVSAGLQLFTVCFCGDWHSMPELEGIDIDSDGLTCGH